MKPVLPESGDIFQFPYPFVREEFTVSCGDDEGGWFEKKVLCWKPGTRQEDLSDDHRERFDCVADGMGQQILTVVGTFKPGKYPTRIFFTRQWCDPDGKVFGKGGLRILTFSGWRSLINGYRYPFELSKQLPSARLDLVTK